MMVPKRGLHFAHKKIELIIFYFSFWQNLAIDHEIAQSTLRITFKGCILFTFFSSKW
jgi:hypothetical protein